MPDDKCINCRRPLVIQNGVSLCSRCNTAEITQAQLFLRDEGESEHVFIECPGATLYAPESNEVIAGVKFYNDDDPTKGYRIVERPVFAPNHKRRRRIERQALGRIRRCQACQDYTIRMRRREGRDFCIPSHRHPNRKKLRAMTHVEYEP
ncbi:MAG: hypothetical protein ABIE70_11965 [bacterium]